MARGLRAFPARRPRRVIEPQVGITGDAVPGVEDTSMNARPPNLAQPVGNGISVSYPALRERLEHARAIGRSDEHVEVLGIASEPSNSAKRQTRRRAETESRCRATSPARPHRRRRQGRVSLARCWFPCSSFAADAAHHAFPRNGVRRQRGRRAAASHHAMCSPARVT